MERAGAGPRERVVKCALGAFTLADANWVKTCLFARLFAARIDGDPVSSDVTDVPSLVLNPG